VEVGQIAVDLLNFGIRWLLVSNRRDRSTAHIVMPSNFHSYLLFRFPYTFTRVVSLRILEANILKSLLLFQFTESQFNACRLKFTDAWWGSVTLLFTIKCSQWDLHLSRGVGDIE